MNRHIPSANSSFASAPEFKGEDACIPVQIAASGDLCITCYENQIPAFVEAELERLYASLFSSLPVLHQYGSTGNVSTYVVRKGGEIVTLWLFRREAREVRVINEAIRINADDVRQFADYIFSLNNPPDVISFHAVEAAMEGLPYPCQRVNCSEDSVLTLPSSAEAYLNSLGKATRKNIKRYTNRLKEAFPSFDYRIYAKDEVSEQHVRDIIRLNRIRMARKGKVSGIDAEEERRLVSLVKSCGLVGVATIDGKVCAGAIVYRFGDNYFSFVRAHDPAYNDHRLGIVGAYLLVCECIARGGKELHFMWGREEHKALLLGVERKLDHVAVYRSYAHALLNMDTVMRNMLFGSLRWMKIRMLEKAKQEQGLVAQLASRALGGLRSLIRIRRKLLQRG